MKVKSLALLGLLASISVANAQVLSQTQTGSWSIGRTTTLTGTQVTESLSTTASTNVNVGKYTGAGTLNRVVIRYIQPNPPTSAILTGNVAITDGVGNTTFSSLSVGNSTTITAPAALNFGIFLADGSFITTPSTYSDSDGIVSSTLLTAPNTLSGFTVEYNRNEILWDSDVVGGSTPAELAGLFVGGGPFSFALSSALQFSFARDNTESITLSTSGTDSGYIQIQYYVPEPSSAVLGGLGLLALFRRRRA